MLVENSNSQKHFIVESFRMEIQFYTTITMNLRQWLSVDIFMQSASTMLYTLIASISWRLLEMKVSDIS